MFKRILPTAIAISAGLLVLLGSFFPGTLFAQVRYLLVRWAMVVGAFAFIIAFLHFARVHVDRLARFRKDALTSLVVVVSALGTFALVVLPGQGPAGDLTQQVLTNIMVPGEAALLALTGVTLILASMRLLRKRRTFGALLFIVVVVVMLLGAVPYISILGDVAGWIQRVPAMAGMRGLLLGVALGITLTGLRVIGGTTRPHSDD